MVPTKDKAREIVEATHYLRCYSDFDKNLIANIMVEFLEDEIKELRSSIAYYNSEQARKLILEQRELIDKAKEILSKDIYTDLYINLQRSALKKLFGVEIEEQKG